MAFVGLIVAVYCVSTAGVASRKLIDKRNGVAVNVNERVRLRRMLILH